MLDVAHWDSFGAHWDSVSNCPTLTDPTSDIIFCVWVYLRQTIIHKLSSDSTGARYPNIHKEIMNHVIYKTEYKVIAQV